MRHILTAYFSASGTTAKASKALAEAAGADLFEIEPEVPYTKADLNWMDKKSRSTLEMNNPAARPAIKSSIENMNDYDVIFLGFPIWWYREPSIIDTFLEQYDFSGKTIILFATSGGSGLGKAAKEIQRKVSSQAKVIEGKLLNGRVTKESLAQWLDSLDL